MVVRKKKWMSVVLAICILLSTSITTYATCYITESQVGIQPLWINTNDMTICLTIENGKAVLSASISGYSGVEKSTGVAVLERQNLNGTYTEIERWSNLSSNSRDLDWTATRYVTEDYTYRFTITATVFRNGMSENISSSISQKA